MPEIITAQQYNLFSRPLESSNNTTLCTTFEAKFLAQVDLVAKTKGHSLKTKKNALKIKKILIMIINNFKFS